MKKMILLTSLAASVLLFAACGGNTTASSTNESSSQAAISETSSIISTESTSTKESSSTSESVSEEPSQASFSEEQYGVENSSEEVSQALPEPGKADLKTADEALEYLIKQLGYEGNDDIYFQERQGFDDGNYHFGVFVKSYKENGGSGSAGSYTVSKDGYYSQGDVLGNAY